MQVTETQNAGLKREYKVVVGQAELDTELNAKLADMDTWTFLEQSKVEVACTTDDPADDLAHHIAQRTLNLAHVHPPWPRSPTRSGVRRQHVRGTDHAPRPRRPAGTPLRARPARRSTTSSIWATPPAPMINTLRFTSNRLL